VLLAFTINRPYSTAEESPHCLRSPSSSAEEFLFVKTSNKIKIKTIQKLLKKSKNVKKSKK
jgi:hypothetical protein